MKDRLITGIGMPMVDVKIQPTDSSRENPHWQEVIHTHPECWRAGGIMTNVLSTMRGLLDSGNNIQFIGSIGKDPLGLFYQKEILHLGNLQQVAERPTGTVVFRLNNDGSFNNMQVNQGAARFLQVPEQEQPIGLCVLEIPFFRPSPDHNRNMNEILKVKQVVDRSKGYVALNLSSARKGGTEKEILITDLKELDIQPDIVIGNQAEIDYLNDNKNTDPADNLREVSETLFPQATITIVTLGENGSIIQFHGKQYEIPACPIQKNQGDIIGCGDVFMGTVLSSLIRQSLDRITEQDLLTSARRASFAAKLVGESSGSRLTPDQFIQINLHN